MFLTLRDSKGRTQSIEDWVKDIRSEDQAALYKALAPYVEANSGGPVSLEKFRNDFCALSDSDRKEFMKTMQEGIRIAHSAMNESEFDAALQADLDRRNKEAYGAAWEKSVADAKARQEQAKREAPGDIDAAIAADLEKRKQGVA